MVIDGCFSAIFTCSVVTWFASAVNCDQKPNSGIFRDQLMPFLGGKIPESAFSPERLFTNRLNKNGIYAVDGVYFQERHPERHHFPRAFLPNTIKIKIPVDNTHVAKPGKFFKAQTIDTTYLISKTVRATLRPPYLNFKDFPIIPAHSLKLSCKAKIRKSPDFESFQIFQSYFPLLKKMHELYK